MILKNRAWVATLFVASCLSCIVSRIYPLSAQPAYSFYKGKIISIYSGLSAAGAYTAYARLLSKSIVKYIPGEPTAIVRIMTGASGLTLANWLYNVAPRDGLVFGIFHERIGLEPVIDPERQKFDGRKFTWIGSMSKQTFVCFTWYETGVKTLDDLKTKETIFAAGATDGAGSVIPRMMNAMLGTKMRIVLGYDGEQPMLAMERREVDGRCYGWDAVKAVKPDWIQDGKIYVPLQTALTSHPDLKQVPLMTDLISNTEDREVLDLVFAPDEMGRPFAGPPGIPADRATVLQEAFMKAVADPELLADAAKERLEISGPISGPDIEAMVSKLYTTPKEVAERARAFRKQRGDEKDISK